MTCDIVATHVPHSNLSVADIRFPNTMLTNKCLIVTSLIQGGRNPPWLMLINLMPIKIGSSLLSVLLRLQCSKIRFSGKYMV